MRKFKFKGIECLQNTRVKQTCCKQEEFLDNPNNLLIFSDQPLGFETCSIMQPRIRMKGWNHKTNWQTVDTTNRKG